MPVLKKNRTRCGSWACRTAVVLANPVPEGGTSPFLASRPEKLQAARLPSPVPKSAGAHLGALGVSGSEVLWAVGSGRDGIIPWLLLGPVAFTGQSVAVDACAFLPRLPGLSLLGIAHEWEARISSTDGSVLSEGS